MLQDKSSRFDLNFSLLPVEILSKKNVIVNILTLCLDSQITISSTSFSKHQTLLL